MLYTAIPILYVTGFYRTVNTQHFALEVGFGFVFDLFFTLSLFFLQAINNATLSTDTMTVGEYLSLQIKYIGNLSEAILQKNMALGPLQLIFISVKILQLADLILEFLMFIFEVYRLRNL